VGFRSGRINRQSVSGLFRRFAPVQATDTLLDVDLQELYDVGKRLLLVDVDNTLVEWRSEEIPDTTTGWINRAKELGFDVCIISNTRNVKRLEGLAQRLNIEYILGRFKPSTFMFHQALEKFNRKPEEAVMVGDQLFTDVFGANRSGIDAIWVRQMAPRDFVGTKLSRFGERLIRGRIYRGLQEIDLSAADPSLVAASPLKKEPVDEDLPVGGTAAFEMLRVPIVRQFLKFCVVGGSSTVLDVGLHFLLMWHIAWGGVLVSETVGQWLVQAAPSLFIPLATRQDQPELVYALAAVPVFKVLTAGIAILNSFIWNRRWTFRIRGREHRAVQLQKFFVVAIIGLILNTVITTGLVNIVPGHPKRSWAVATVIATIVVAFWNFGGQKLWTFRQKK
jgi:uncharacterized protein